jgi:hypothetical protein
MEGDVSAPMILMMVEDADFYHWKRAQFFVVADAVALPVNGDATRSLELLIKVFYAFNLR